MGDRELALFLQSSGVVPARAIARAQEDQLYRGGRFDTAVLATGGASEAVLLEALGRYRRTRPVPPGALAQATPEVAGLITARMAARFEVVPFRLEGKTLLVARLDPGDLLVEDELQLLTGCMVSSFVALEVRLHEALAHLYGVRPSERTLEVLRRLRIGEAAMQPPSVVRRAPPPPPPPPPASPQARLEVASEAHPPEPGDLDVPSPAPVLELPIGAPRETPKELEISAEELDQFPSLRAMVGAETETGTGEGEEAGHVPRTAARESGAPAWPGPAASAPAAAPAQPGGLVATSGPLPLSSQSPQTPESRLAAASTGFETAEMRDDIADAILDFCAPYLRRRLLLIQRGERVVGWRGEGEGVDHEGIRAIAIPLAEPSVFSGLTNFWLGPLPPMPRNLELVLALGGGQPSQCVILPVTVKGKTVCYLYGDNLESGVGGVPLAQLRRLVAKASLAFQVYILRSKIRTM